MTEKPITPTRIIPAGAPLPARPPEPDEEPPWRTPPPPPPPAPPAEPPPVPVPVPEPPVPGVIEVHVRYDPYVPEDVPEPSRWARLTAGIDRLGRWRLLLALALAVVPIPGVGYSAGTVWAYTVSETRATFGAPYGYALATVPLLLAARAVRRGGSFRSLLALAICLIGLTGALHWYDPITALTGVHPR